MSIETVYVCDTWDCGARGDARGSYLPQGWMTVKVEEGPQGLKGKKITLCQKCSSKVIRARVVANA